MTKRKLMLTIVTAVTLALVATGVGLFFTNKNAIAAAKTELNQVVRQEANGYVLDLKPELVLEITVEDLDGNQRTIEYNATPADINAETIIGLVPEKHRLVRVEIAQLGVPLPDHGKTLTLNGVKFKEGVANVTGSFLDLNVIVTVDATAKAGIFPVEITAKGEATYSGDDLVAQLDQDLQKALIAAIPVIEAKLPNPEPIADVIVEEKPEVPELPAEEPQQPTQVAPQVPVTPPTEDQIFNDDFFDRFGEASLDEFGFDGFSDFEEWLKNQR